MPLKTNWPNNPYEFLVLEKFGEYIGANPVVAQLSGLQIPPENSEAANKYRSELEALPPEEISQRVQAIVYAERDQAKEEIERSDSLAFFNQPHATPDYQHWLDKGIWLRNEAAALSLDKCPYVVNPESLEPFRERSFFVEEFVERDLLLADAHPKYALNISVTPYQFIQWAIDQSLDLPLELTRALAKNKHAQKPSKTPKDTLPARERDSLLKLVLAMATGGYGYKPDKPRNPTAGEIESDLHALGLSLDKDTIRKYLIEASDCHYSPAIKDAE